MLTFEKVLQIFSEYLSADPEVDTAKTKYGYVILFWDNLRNVWYDSKTCATPESLFNGLLSAYRFYRVFAYTRGDRELPSEVRTQIEEEMNLFRTKLENQL